MVIDYYAILIMDLFSRFIDHETMSLQSTVSLGRVGRVLGGDMKLASQSGSKESVSRATTPEVKTPTPVADLPNPNAHMSVVTSAEPDIVASAKASIQTDQPVISLSSLTPEGNSSVEPIAPPRRRRKPQAPTPPQVDPPAPPVQPLPATLVFEASPGGASSPMPASLSAPSLSSALAPPIADPQKRVIHSLKRGHEFSLDLTSATKGLYVIKPQVFAFSFLPFKTIY